MKRKLMIGSVLVLMVGSAFLLWHWRNEARYSFKIQFEEVVDFGFEAFATGDWGNAEEILSSLFDKFGNELNLFRKMDRSRQLKARSLYGYLIFRKGNFKKSERVWRPIFKNAESMREFVQSHKFQRKMLLFYLTDLAELKKSRELLRISNLCYDNNGSPSEILRKFGDTPLIRAMAGEVFYQSGAYEKAMAVLRIFFKKSQLNEKLDARRRATIRWYYVSSLICKEKGFGSKKNDFVQKVFSEFFDENMNETKLFDDLSEEDQIACRMTYAQLMLQSDDYEKILDLLDVFFDDDGRTLQQFKNPCEETIIRSIYGYALWRCGEYASAKQVWYLFPEGWNECLAKNIGSDERDLLKLLRENIYRISI
ncbi:MAG: hypothetical protein J6P84_04035 [Alphaproteobacteria bacterium]|nr:hypothetical protein [Alphaproteobacteria bacterium]